jgi:AbrB family looped-hinge helix DNA binding protein
MPITHLSEKGQILIPKPLRRKLGLRPGHKVHLSEQQGRLVVSPVPEDPIAAAAGFLQEKAGARALLDWINWGEFFCAVKRGVGSARADEALRLLEQLPIDLIPVDQALVRAAAEIKSQHHVSYADAFCVATAQRVGGTVLTQRSRVPGGPASRQGQMAREVARGCWLAVLVEKQVRVLIGLEDRAAVLVAEDVARMHGVVKPPRVLC